jgi:hypothetical protein
METKIIALDNLLLSRSAYFWQQAAKGTTFQARNILTELGASNGWVDGQPLLEVYQRAGYKNAAAYSLIVFRKQREPAFLKNVAGHFDLLYCMVVMVEYEGFLGWTARNVNGVDSLLQGHAYPLPTKVFHRVASQHSGNVKQYSARALDRKRTGVASKSISGNNLENTSSPFENRNFAVSGYHISEDDASRGIRITTGTSGAAEGGSCTLEEFVGYVVSFIDEVIKSDKASRTRDDDGVNNPFIKSFAKPVELSDLTNKEKATFVTLMGDALEQQHFAGEIELYRRMRGGKMEPVKMDEVVQVVGGTFPLLEKGDGMYLLGSIMKAGQPNEYDDDMAVRIKRKHIELKLPVLRKFYLQNRKEGTEISIEDYLNEQKQFLIYFSGGTHVFLYGQLYEIGAIFDHAEALLQIVIKRDELMGMTSEKGELEKKDTSFPSDSLFGFVEQKLSAEHKCTYLICDDLGEEYADFIGGNEEHLFFYHCKQNGHRNKNNLPGISGSKFADIASQVTKNLEFMFMNVDSFAEKIDRNNRVYSLDKVKTTIPRLTGPSFEKGTQGAVEVYRKFCEHPHSDTNRHAYMVVDFLSKSEFEKAIKSAMKPNVRKPPELIQLMVQLNSLVSSCKAQRVNFYLVCQP